MIPFNVWSRLGKDRFYVRGIYLECAFGVFDIQGCDISGLLLFVGTKFRGFRNGEFSRY